MILIYCPEESPRAAWIFDLVFKQLLGLEYRLTTFPEELKQSDGPRLNYSFKPLGEEPFIQASGLLFERNIRDQSANLIPGPAWHGLPTVFSHAQTHSSLPFDIFSAIFYFVARYEEYLPFEHDVHERFQSSESLSFHLGILEEPIVNQWVRELAKVLNGWFGNQIVIREPEYRFIPTIDIDNAWAYAHKGIGRTLGGFWKDRKSMESRNFRFQVLRKNQMDPYHTYGLIDQFNEQAGIKPVWFFLVATYGRHDKNNSTYNSHFRSLLHDIAREQPVGLHPSYAAGSDAIMISNEALRLAEITGHPVTRSRQHYLRMRMPDTYRALIANGIREDYTMGFADCPGFRAGIATPYRFFDLEQNRLTELTLFPFQVMDTTLRQYLKLNPDQAIDKITSLVQKVRSVNGTFISLWHNESLSEWKEWSGWSEVYRKLLSVAA